jgi:membrane protease YdiL (CAAX protease family)
MNSNTRGTASSEVRAVRRREVVIAVGVALLVPHLLGWLISLHFHAHRQTTIGATYALLIEVPAALAAAALLTRLKWWRRAGWRAPEWRQMWLLWLPVTVVVSEWTLLLLYSPSRGAAYTAATAALALAVGFTEEMWFRGLLLEALRSRGAISAVIVSAAVFGVLHVWAFRGLASVSQVFSAFGFGLIWGAARIRIGAIWPLVLIHAAQDFGALQLLHGATPLRPPMYRLDAALDGLIVGVGLVYALVLTRRSRMERAQLTAERASRSEEPA